jgi:hypothetical protein
MMRVCRFVRALTRLKLAADYQAVDATRLDDWIRDFDPDLRQYVYAMVRHGADRYGQPQGQGQ